MAVLIGNVVISKNPVRTGEKFKIQVSAVEVINEPKTYRLPFGLGKEKGALGSK